MAQQYQRGPVGPAALRWPAAPQQYVSPQLHYGQQQFGQQWPQQPQHQPWQPSQQSHQYGQAYNGPAQQHYAPPPPLPPAPVPQQPYGHQQLGHHSGLPPPPQQVSMPGPYAHQQFGQHSSLPPQQISMPSALQQVDPYMVLSSLGKVKIEEKINALEAALNNLFDVHLEMANKYVVRTMNDHALFMAVEQSDFLMRCCAPGDCRGIKVDVAVLGQDKKSCKEANGMLDFNWNPFAAEKKVKLANANRFLKLEKDCQLTFCCFNRPVISILDSRSQQIGTITDPWACCDMTFTVKDAHGYEKLKAVGGCCQLGLLCPCPCGPCAKVHFPVHDTSGNEVAHLTKVVPNCLTFFFAEDADNYIVDFGVIKDPHTKALLLSLALFIDFRYFNEKSGGDGTEGLLSGLIKWPSELW